MCQASLQPLRPASTVCNLFSADPYKLTRYGPEGFLSSLSKGPLASCEGLSRATELRRSLSDCAEAAGRLLAPPATLRVVARVADGKKLQAQLATAAAAFADKTRKGRRKRAAGAAAEGLACDGGAFAEQSYGIWNTLELAPPLYQAVAKVRCCSPRASFQCMRNAGPVGGPVGTTFPVCTPASQPRILSGPHGASTPRRLRRSARSTFGRRRRVSTGR